MAALRNNILPVPVRLGQYGTELLRDDPGARRAFDTNFGLFVAAQKAQCAAR